jgi:hypothetical protein
VVLLALFATTAGLAWWLGAAATGGPERQESVAEGPQKQREAALATIYRDLDARRPVRLLDAEGQERWHRWATEKDRPPLQPALGGHRSIRALDLLCQCELLPRAPADGYVLSAQVQFGQRLLIGRAGLYLMGEEIDTPTGRLYRYLALQLLELGKAASLRFRVEHFREPKPNTRTHVGHSVLLFDTRPLAELGEWHTIEVEVSAQAVTVRYDGAPVKNPIPRPRLDRQVQAFEKGLVPGGLPPLKSTGSLGLLAADCSARFRDVVVKPLSGK